MKKKVVLIANGVFACGESVWMREHEYEYGNRRQRNQTTAAETAKSIRKPNQVGMASPGGKDEIMMGTATTGGFTYLWGAACAEILNKYVDGVNVTAQITTGGSENMVRIVNNEMPMGIAGSNVVAQFL